MTIQENTQYKPLQRNSIAGSPQFVTREVDAFDKSIHRFLTGKIPEATFLEQAGNLPWGPSGPADSDGRYFLVVVCDYSGYVYAERLDGKSGKDVAVKLQKVFKKKLRS